jgi:hypothetical protein
MHNGPTHRSGTSPSALEAALWIVFVVVSIPSVVFLLGYWLTTDLSARAFQAAMLGMLALQSIGFIRLMRSSKRFSMLSTVLVGLLVAGALFMTLFVLWFSTDEKPLVQTTGPALVIAHNEHAPHTVTDLKLTT